MATIVSHRKRDAISQLQSIAIRGGAKVNVVGDRRARGVDGLVNQVQEGTEIGQGPTVAEGQHKLNARPLVGMKIGRSSHSESCARQCDPVGTTQPEQLQTVSIGIAGK